jgi:glutamine synthetase
MIHYDKNDRKKKTLEGLKLLEEDKDIKFVKCIASDMQGHIREVTVFYPRDSDSRDMKSIGVDGSVLFSEIIMTKESDMVFVPDMSTLRKIPWTSDTAIVICDLYYPPRRDGSLKPFEGCARGKLKELARSMERNLPKYVKKIQPERKIKNVWAAFAAEMELVLVKKDYDYTKIHLDPDLKNNHYFKILVGEIDEMLKKFMLYAHQLGLKPEKYHSEVAWFQYELNFEAADILTSADNFVLATYIMNAVAKQYGYLFSLISKFSELVNGTGKHMHENIFALEEINGKYVQVNLFHDKRRKDGFSWIGRSYTVGNLRYGREYTILTNPAPISFKRFDRRKEAPQDVFFGWEDRTSFARGHMKDTNKIRTEIRSGDCLSNAYWHCGAHLAAGLEGIRKGLTLEMRKGRGYYNFGQENKLPLHFGEALNLMNGSKMLRKYFGDFIIDALYTLGSITWNEECMSITDRDIRKYFLFDPEM